MNLKDSIKKILREEFEKDICNTLVNTYEEGFKKLKSYLGSMESNPNEWAKIKNHYLFGKPILMK